MRRKRGIVLALVVLSAACVRDLDALQRLDAVEDEPTGPSDAGTGFDGSSAGDANDATTVDASPSCGAAFCASFDPPSSVAPFGFASVVGDPAALMLGAGLSAPSALQLIAAPADPPRGLNVDLGTAKVIDFSWNVRVLQIGGAGASDAVMARITCGTSELEVKAKRSSKLQLQFNDSSSEVGIGSDWVAVRFSWDIPVGQGRLVVGSSPAVQVATFAGCAGEVRASIGWLDLGASRDGTWEALFDDVRIATTK